MPGGERRRALLETYLDACGNEDWADKRALERAGRADRVRVFPARVSKLLFIRSDLALVLLGWAVNLGFIVASPAFFLFEAWQWLRVRGGEPGAAPRARRVWLLFSDAFSALSPALLETLAPDFVVTGPHHRGSQRFPGTSRRAIADGMQRGDALAAYLLALRATALVALRLGPARASQAYTAFDWFATERVLARLLAEAEPEEIVFLNHYDRWAVLFDRLDTQARHTLVQHGILYKDAPIPVRIRRVDRLYVYSEESAERFRENALHDACRPELHRQLPSLVFSEPVREGQGPLRVLLIGDPLQVARDLETAKALASVFGVELLVKPHPRFPPTAYVGLADDGAELVLEKDRFPRADLVICGVSTLGIQYETAGCEVLWYETLSLDEIVGVVASLAAHRG